MDSKLATYLDQQDSGYATHLEGRAPPNSRDERIHLQREIACIEKHLANNECDEFVSADDWNERLTECKLRLLRLLKEEQDDAQRHGRSCTAPA